MKARVERHQDRTLYDLRGVGFPEIPLFGQYRQLGSAPPLPCHAHRGVMEICYLVSGRQTYRVGGRSHGLKGNDVFVTFPGEIHDSGPHPQERGRLYWMHLRLSPAPRHLLHLDAAATRELTREMLALPVRCFRGSDALRRRFDAVFARLEQPARRLETGHVLLALLLEVVACSRRFQDRKPSADISHALAWLQERLPDRITIAELAAHARLSPSRFMARFKSEVGMSAGEYILRRRVEGGCALLAQGRSVLDAALEAGFCSSQYFATQFKRVTRQTPSEYRAAAARRR
jgi:AraC-like DNA-binding protein